jgi:hypothetical protein
MRPMLFATVGMVAIMVAWKVAALYAGEPKRPDLIQYSREPIETVDGFGNVVKLHAGGMIEVFQDMADSRYYLRTADGFESLPDDFAGPVISMGPPVHPDELKPKKR